MHDTMGRPPTHPKRLLLAVNDEWLEAVDRWRRQQAKIPTQSEAIRRLVEFGMKADAKPVKTREPAVEAMEELRRKQEQRRINWQKRAQAARNEKKADEWRRQQPSPIPTRSEALRTVAELGMKVSKPKRKPRR